jgi:hypothetical protein
MHIQLVLTRDALVNRQISNVDIPNRKIDKHVRFFVLNLVKQASA